MLWFFLIALLAIAGNAHGSGGKKPNKCDKGKQKLPVICHCETKHNAKTCSESYNVPYMQWSNLHKRKHKLDRPGRCQSNNDCAANQEAPDIDCTFEDPWKAGVPLQINCSASSDPEGLPLLFTFYFGDGTSTSNSNGVVSHTYALPVGGAVQDFNLTIQVTDQPALAKCQESAVATNFITIAAFDDSTCFTKDSTGSVTGCSDADYCDGATTDFYTGPEGTDGIGQCTPGVYRCQNGVASQVSSQTLPSPDYCLDGLNQDCVGGADDDTAFQVLFYPDVDGDGFGAIVPGELFCAGAEPENYVLVGGDCDDTNPLVHPGARELCDGLNNACVDAFVDGSDECSANDQCDGAKHECVPVETGCKTAADCPLYTQTCDTSTGECKTFSLVYVDNDGDGFGSGLHPVEVHEGKTAAAGTSSFSTDCDDNDPLVYPGAPPRCGTDSNCDGIPDVDVQSDPYNCGACGKSCSAPNPAVFPVIMLEGTCVSGRCCPAPAADIRTVANLAIVNTLKDDDRAIRTSDSGRTASMPAEHVEGEVAVRLTPIEYGILAGSASQITIARQLLIGAVNSCGVCSTTKDVFTAMSIRYPPTGLMFTVSVPTQVCFAGLLDSVFDTSSPTSTLSQYLTATGVTLSNAGSVLSTLTASRYYFQCRSAACFGMNC